MDYRFAKQDGQEIFHSIYGLEGDQIITEKYDDCTITHRFTIDKVLKEGKDSVWYAIKDHQKTVDKFDQIQDLVDMAYVNSELALALLNMEE